MVTLTESKPFAFTGPADSARLDLDAAAAPAINVADLEGNDAIEGEESDTVLTSARVEVRVLVKLPSESVVPDTLTRFPCADAPELEPAAASATAILEQGFPFASLRLTVKLAWFWPSAMIDEEVDTLMPDCASTGGPAMKAVFPPLKGTGVTKDNTLVSAFLDFRVQFDKPFASDAEHAE